MRQNVTITIKHLSGLYLLILNQNILDIMLQRFTTNEMKYFYVNRKDLNLLIRGPYWEGISVTKGRLKIQLKT